MNLILDLKRYLLCFLDAKEILVLSLVSREWERICREPSVWYPRLEDNSLPKELAFYLFYVKSMMEKRSALNKGHLLFIAEISSDFSLWEISRFGAYWNYYLSTPANSTFTLSWTPDGRWHGNFRGKEINKIQIKISFPLGKGSEIRWKNLRPILLRIDQAFLDLYERLYEIRCPNPSLTHYSVEWRLVNRLIEDTLCLRRLNLEYSKVQVEKKEGTNYIEMVYESRMVWEGTIRGNYKE